MPYGDPSLGIYVYYFEKMNIKNIMVLGRAAQEYNFFWKLRQMVALSCCNWMRKQQRQRQSTMFLTQGATKVELCFEACLECHTVDGGSLAPPNMGVS